MVFGDLSRPLQVVVVQGWIEIVLSSVVLFVLLLGFVLLLVGG